MNKFKVGDRVKVIYHDLNSLGRIIKIYEEELIENKYVVKFDNEQLLTCGYAEDELELIEENFEVGDIVKVNENCTIGEIYANYSNGCLRNTLKFLEENKYKSNPNYTIKYVYSDDDVKGCDIDGLIVNPVCLELVEKKKEIKKMTLAEISEKLGYEVKIIKEELKSELIGKDEVEEDKEFKIGDKVWVNMMFSAGASDFASILNLSFEDTHEKGEIIDIDEKNLKYWGGKYLIKFDNPAYITAGYDADNLKLIEDEEEN